MPLFEFVCPSCQNTEEVIESYHNSEKEHICNKCKSKMNKQPTTSNFTISGYSYSNNYSNKN